VSLIQETRWKSLEKTIQSVGKKPVIEDITIIIPTLGRPILEECLTKIISGSRWPQALIIVHQGNKAGIKDWVRKIQKIGIQTVYVQSAERGKPSAINIAFTKTKTSFACMVDDDCFVHADWLKNMRKCLQINPDWIITGRVEPAGNETIAIVQSREAVVYSRPRLKFDLFVGGNMGAAMDIIQQVGPFDEDPLLRTAAEDVEWGYRALKKSIPISYAPEVAVSHYGWRVESENFNRLKAYAHGHGSFYGKYLRRGDIFIFFRASIHLVRALRKWIYGKITGKTDRVLVGRAYCMGLIPGIVAGFQSQHYVGKAK
jgi:GT2 family glycosyltransferase